MYKFMFPTRTVSAGTVGYRGQNFAVRADDPNNLDSNSGCAIVENLFTVNCQATDPSTAINNAIYTRGGIASDQDLFTGGTHHVIGSLLADSTSSFGDIATFKKSISGVSASFSGTNDTTVNVPAGGVTTNKAIIISSLNSEGITTLNGATSTNKITIQYTPSATNGVIPYALENFGTTHLAGDVTADNNINVTKGVSAATLATSGAATIGSTLISGGNRLTVDAVASRVDINATGQSGTGLTLDANTFTSKQNISIVSTAAPAIDPLSGNYTPSALNVAGGATIGDKARFLKDVEIVGGITGSQLKLNIGTQATDANTASLVIPNGGISAYNALYQGTLVAGAGLAATAANYNTAMTAVIRAPTIASSGNAWVGGDQQVTGALTAGGATLLKSTATIAGATTLQSTLTATGAASFQASLNPSIDRTTSTQAALQVPQGGATINGNIISGGAVSTTGVYVLADTTKNGAQLNLTSEADATKTGTIGMANNYLRLQAPSSAPIRFISDRGIGASLSTATGTSDDSYFRAGVNGFFYKSSSSSPSPTYTAANNATQITDITAMTSRFQTSFGVDSASLFAGPMHLTRTSSSSTDPSLAVEGVSNFNDLILASKGLTVSSGDVNITSGALIGGSGASFSGLVTTTGAMNASGAGAFGGSVSASTFSATSSLIATSTTASIATNGGALIGANIITKSDAQIGGNLDVKGTSLLENDVHISSTTATTSSSKQALVVDGRAAFNMGILVSGPSVLQGDTTITGVLRTTGNIEQSNVKDYFVEDNIPSFNVDSKLTTSGFALHRYQEANDAGTGFVVTSTDVMSSATVSVASATDTSHFVLDNATATTALGKLGTFIGWCRFISGTGAGQVRYVKDYNANTQTITIASNADQTSYAATRGGVANLIIGKDLTTQPDGTTVIAFYSTGIAAMLHLEAAGSGGPEWHLGYMSRDPISSILSPDVNQYGLLKLKNLVARENVKTDAILPNTPNGPISLNNAISIYNNGNITGIASLNGANTFAFTTLVIPETAYLTNGAVALPLPAGVTDPSTLFGILKYYIKGVDMNASICSGERGCTANSTVKQQATSLIVAAGTLGEQVDIVWTYGSAPVLTHTTARPTANQTGNPITYKITYVYI